MGERAGVGADAHSDWIAWIFDKMIGIAVVCAAPSVVVAHVDRVERSRRGDAVAVFGPDARAKNHQRFFEGAGFDADVERWCGIALGRVGRGDDDDIGCRFAEAEIGGIREACGLGLFPGDVGEAQAACALWQSKFEIAAGALFKGGLDDGDEFFAVAV